MWGRLCQQTGTRQRPSPLELLLLQVALCRLQKAGVSPPSAEPAPHDHGSSAEHRERAHTHGEKRDWAALRRAHQGDEPLLLHGVRAAEVGVEILGVELGVRRNRLENVAGALLAALV